MGERPATLSLLALACVLALAAARAQAQPAGDKPTPFDVCARLASLRIGPERGSAASPLPHELARELGAARAACEQAAQERPNEGRVFALLARVRLLSGDGKGALEAARKGAELRSSNAQVLLGVMHADGVHLPRDHAAALELFRLAERARSPYAHFNLGVLFANGWGVERDEEYAARYFRLAALDGDPLAMQLFAQRDRPNAGAWLRRAAEAMAPEGAPTGMRIAELGRAAPDEKALLAWYEEKARAGEPWAQAYLGMLRESGQWLRQDYGAAADSYARAGAAGNVPAQVRLAKLYREGLGVARDEAEARRWGEMSQVQRCEALEREAAGANACDRLAADRYDPQKVLPGVDSFCMRRFAGRAVAACSAAAKESPSTARYRAQLARALAHTGNFERARREAGGAAAAGSTPAMILMGVMSQRGLGGAQSDAEALAWYRKAADAGDLRGANLVAMSALNGVGVAKGSAEAKRLLEAMRVHMVRAGPSISEQAERGDPAAQHNRAALLEQAKNYDEAVQWYTRAADQGFEASAMNLAQMYEKGLGVKEDRAEAMKRYRVLASHGNGEARYRFARLAAQAGQYAEALKAYERSVRADDYRAMLDLGELHERGRGVPKDARRAAGLYERAAERSPWARFKLGAMYAAGAGVAKDHAKARQWFRRSADDGNAAARNNLGVMADQGLGVAPDYAAARELYLSALGGGVAEARGNLERFYAEGRGAPSGAAAAAWYLPGAEAGVMSAQYRLGEMYAKGEGVPRDERLAAEWLSKAAQQGHPAARQQAAELLHAQGRHLEAASFGHEGAARALAAEMAKAGNAREAEEFLRRFKEPREWPAPRAWPTGMALDPGADPQRALQTRIAGVGSMQAAAADAGMTNLYEIIRWFPETDGGK
jgi:TPR repeat protein